MTDVKKVEMPDVIYAEPVLAMDGERIDVNAFEHLPE